MTADSIKKPGKPRKSDAVLVTGFEPFGKWGVNSSWEAAKLLHGKRIEGMLVQSVRLPVAYGAAFEAAAAAFGDLNPAAVIMSGLADSQLIRIERIAVNADSSQEPDGLGVKKMNEIIDPSGPAAFWSGLPADEILSCLVAAGIPACHSFSAGTFVCNDLFYRFMSGLRGKKRKPLAGFIHVPPLPAPGIAGMPLETIARSLEIAVSCCAPLAAK